MRWAKPLVSPPKNIQTPPALCLANLFPNQPASSIRGKPFSHKGRRHCIVEMTVLHPYSLRNLI